ATRRRGSARFTHTRAPASSTFQMSEDTPPGSASMRAGVPSPARCRKSAMSASLGCKALDAPGTAVARIEQAVVQPVGASLPELDCVRRYAVAAPVRRARRRVAITAARLFQGALERSSVRNALALSRGPGREAR